MSPSRANPGRAPTAVLVGALLLAGLVALPWAAAVATGRSDLEKADLRLVAEARGVQAAFASEVARADARAGALSVSRRVQRALVARDRSVLRSLVGGHPVAVFRGEELLAGSIPAGAVRRSVIVTARGRRLGRVVGYVPLGDALVGRLRRATELPRGDRIALTRVRPASRRLGHPADRMIAGKRFRAYAVELVGNPSPAYLEVATPHGAVTRNSRRVGFWVGIALATTAATIAVAVYALTSARRRRLEAAVAADDARALGLVGDALASTHNPDRLLPIILHAAMQATGASGGRILRAGEDVAREGMPTDGEPLTLELATEEPASEPATLVLYPPPRGFDERTIALGHSLAAQAAVALENAHLHSVVKRQAVTDELTGLANRRAFMEALTLELRRADRFGGPLAVVFADLDDFKRVNDRFGHLVGDDLLRRFAEILDARTREIDLCARLGGEEFAILLPETDMAGAASLAESLRVAVADLTLPAGPSEIVRVTASFGVAAYPETHTADDLLTAADRALYSAKRQGKNRVVTVRADLDTGAE